MERTENWTVDQWRAVHKRINDELESVAECDDIMCIDRSPYRMDVLDIVRVVQAAEDIAPLPVPERWIVNLISRARNLVHPARGSK